MTTAIPEAYREVLLASTSKNKLAELQTVSKEFGVKLLSAGELGTAPLDVPETGSSYEENALLKARAYAELSGLPALGDDSGLEVQALNGAPGIFSARYAPTDSEKLEKLLRELKEAGAESPEQRRARFVCALALYHPQTKALHTARAELSGEVLLSPRGQGGFGYDPLILLDNLGKTLAEVDFRITCTQGFRALAAKKLWQSLNSR